MTRPLCYDCRALINGLLGMRSSQPAVYEASCACCKSTPDSRNQLRLVDLKRGELTRLRARRWSEASTS